jgi:hypothetical protein
MWGAGINEQFCISAKQNHRAHEADRAAAAFGSTS